MSCRGGLEWRWIHCHVCFGFRCAMAISLPGLDRVSPSPPACLTVEGEARASWLCEGSHVVMQEPGCPSPPVRSSQLCIQQSAFSVGLVWDRCTVDPSLPFAVSRYWCPSNSTNATALPCGSAAVYCPAGSSAPVQALPGQVTVGGDAFNSRTGAVLCPAGSYCLNGIAAPCPAGRFGCSTGIGSALCSGPCTPGFFCPLGSSSSQAYPCGGNASDPLAAAFYCPTGSGSPQAVSSGFYSTGSGTDAPHVASGQALCPAGAYCAQGLKVTGTSA